MGGELLAAQLTPLDGVPGEKARSLISLQASTFDPTKVIQTMPLAVTAESAPAGVTDSTK